MKKRAPGRGRKSIKREPGDDEGESKGRGDDDTDYASDDVDVGGANDDYEEDTRIRRQQTKYKKKPRQSEFEFTLKDDSILNLRPNSDISFGVFVCF